MTAKNQAYEERMKEFETADATPVRKTLAEKLAEGGFGQTETPEEPVRRTRRRA